MPPHDVGPAVVFDIHIYVNALVGPGSEFPRIVEVPPGTGNSAADCLSLAFDGDDFRLFVSPHILRNLTRVLSELGLSAELIEGYLQTVLELVEVSGGATLDPPRKCFDVEDYEDNLIVDLSLACDATLIVSDDTDLTDLSPWHGRMPIVRPHVFVARMVQARRGRRR
ncbi:PIN domain-containing protein [Rathayibacter sp. VKM Ac-2835]|uniref:PIN domain-containing protein n=1 Tax=Rathayibacter sp. VKM Ac-2835 TaxID=2739043 RepID=UPI0015661A3A|nr:PIN domain-containing protein [Rathayibacter sp. VKM Ac-2835]